MIMCVLLCYPVSIHMSQLQATGRPISSFNLNNPCLTVSVDLIIYVVTLLYQVLREACLYVEERGERVGLPAHACSIVYSSATTGWILFKFSTCMQ